MILYLNNEARINLTQPPYNTEGLSANLLGNKGAGKRPSKLKQLQLPLDSDSPSIRVAGGLL